MNKVKISDKIMTFWISNELDGKIDQIALDIKKSKAFVIRKAITDFINSYLILKENKIEYLTYKEQNHDGEKEK